MNLTHAIKWSFLSDLTSKAITPIVFIVLATLLSPEDFGVMSAALMVIGFSQIFWDAGLGKALVQRQTDINDAANVAFWTNIVLGFFLAGLLLISAEPIGRIFFHDLRVTNVIRVMTLQLLLGAASSVHTALLQKDMDFKKIFWIRFTTLGLPGIVSIPLALAGMEYWALVIGSLVGQALQVAILWYLNAWRPSFTFNFKVATQMGAFSKWILLTAVFSWMFTWTDTLVLGYFFSLHEVGLFRIGNQIGVMAFGVIFGFAIPVLYSQYSRSGHNHGAIKSSLLEIFRLTSVISLPLGLIFIAFHNQIELILGEQWKGVGLIIGLIAAKEAANWIVGYYQEACRAMGRPELETLDAACSGLIHIVVLICAARYGFDAFIIGRSIIIGSLGFLLHFLIILYIYKEFNKTLRLILFRIAIWLISIAALSSNLLSQANIQTITGQLCIIIAFSSLVIHSERETIKKYLIYFLKSNRTIA